MRTVDDRGVQCASGVVMAKRVCCALGLVVSMLGAHAQDAANPMRDTAAKVENAANAVGTVWAFPDLVQQCQTIDAMLRGSKVELAALEQFDRALGWVGPAISVVEAGARVAQGKPLDAKQKLAGAAVDQAVCMLAPQMCPAWGVGRSMGEFINGMVAAARVDKQGLDDVMGDLYISILYDEEPTAAELRKLQAAIARGKARRLAQMRTIRTCSDPAQTRSGVEALLKQAGPTAPPMTRDPARARPKEPTPPGGGCAILQDTAASERLSAEDPSAYDDLLARCLKR